MSLEAALADNTAALNKVAALLELSNAGREQAVAKLTSETGAAPRTRATRAKPEETPVAGRPAGSANKAPEPPAAPLIPSEDDLREAAVKFLLGKDDPKRPERAAFNKAIVQHFGLDKIVSAAEGDRAKIIGWYAAKAAGEDVRFDDGEDDTPEVDDDDIG